MKNHLMSLYTKNLILDRQGKDINTVQPEFNCFIHSNKCTH